MLKNLILLLVTCLVMLLLTEGILRLTGVSYPVFSDFDELRGFKLRPGKSGFYEGEGQSNISINSLGYRDLERTLEKPTNVVRIAVLGDSFVEARQVEHEDTFSSVLDRDLDKCGAFSGRSVEVLNFGVGGYNTTQALLTLEKDAIRFDPDIVILGMFAGNDISNNSTKTMGGQSWKMGSPAHKIENGNLALQPASQPPLYSVLLYEATHRSRLLELVNQVRRGLAEKKNVRRLEEKSKQLEGEQKPDVEAGISRWILKEPDTEERKEAWEITRLIIAEMNNLVSTAGGRFIVATIPLAEQVIPDKEKTVQLHELYSIDNLFYPDRTVAHYGEQDGYEVVQLGPLMEQSAVESNTYFHGFPNTALGVGHLNEDGHKAVSRFLYDAICSSNVN